MTTAATQGQKHARRKTHKPPPDLGLIEPQRLIDSKMLVLGIDPSENDAYNRWMVSARFTNGRSFYFPAGIVVEQQLRECRVFPVWARLVWHEGQQHGYYRLILARTTSIERINKQRRRKKKNAKAKCKNKAP